MSNLCKNPSNYPISSQWSISINPEKVEFSDVYKGEGGIEIEYCSKTG